MQILFVTQAFPNPVGAGWERRAAQHVRALCRVGSVTVLLPWSGPDDADKMASAREFCLGLGAERVLHRSTPSLNIVTAQPHLASSGRLRRAWRALRRTPHFDARVHPVDRQRYRDLLDRKFDVVFCFRIESAIWLESVLDHDERPFGIVDFDDVESVLFRQTVVEKGGHSLFWRAKLGSHLRKLERRERQIATRWEEICVCSDADAEKLEQLSGRRPWVIPNSFAFGTVRPETVDQRTNVLFVGSFTHVPNVVGIRWFIDTVWPSVRAAIGDSIRLTIVGYRAPPEILAYHGRDGISVIADADDIAPYYTAANIVVAPLLQGSGTRIKIVEAAAHGRALVTTAIGCEGLDFVDGTHALIADDPSQFSAAVVQLSSDPDRRADLAANARAHAISHFEAQAVERDFVERFARVAPAGGDSSRE